MLETIAIEQFMELVKRAAQSRSRDVRLALPDATILIAEIAIVMSRLSKLEDTMLNLPASNSAIMDGGSLR
jgi:hypothetical protein